MNVTRAIIQLQGRIFNEDYYPHLWEQALSRNHMTAKAIQEDDYSDEQLIMLANDFWDALPDSPVIRTGPFFDLCDIAAYDPSDEGDYEV